MAVLPSAEGHVGDSENLSPLRGEGHPEHCVQEQEFFGDFRVELVDGALRDDLANHPADKLGAVKGPVILCFLKLGCCRSSLLGPRRWRETDQRLVCVDGCSESGGHHFLQVGEVKLGLAGRCRVMGS